MKAVGLTRYLPAEDPESLVDLDLPDPMPNGRDILVRVKAISVNPVDTKVRRSKGPDSVEVEPRVLGWDAAGIVEAVGPDVDLFCVGDAVFYAGSITRPGSNSEMHRVDERIVGRKPSSIDFPDAAALPLTSITAWEMLFERFGIDPSVGARDQNILILAGAGGVGSIAIQLAKWAGLMVTATASRPETKAWCRELGADFIVDHRQPLAPQLQKLGLNDFDYIANFHDTDTYWTFMAEWIKPQGMIGSIVENKNALDLRLLKNKSAAFVWEFMFTRSMFQTPDLEVQGHILNQIANLIDGGKIRGTLQETLKPINAANLRRAHRRLESGTMIGKLVLSGW